ncbi:MAG: Gfo/Idh/MocA family oxidoreductase [Pseudomonadota bacterium]
MSRSYGVAVIGLGAIGQRMLANMPRQGRLTIVGGWDVLSEARRAAAAAGTPVAEEWQALIADPATDCVYIGTPPASHGAYVRAALAAGKAVFCEKPLGIDLAESRALAAAVASSGVPAAINLSLAAARPTAMMAEALEDGSLGTVQGLDIRLRFRAWPRPFQANAGWLGERAEGGFLREVGTHFLYLAERLFGPARLLSADCRFPGGGAAETHALLRLECAGVPVTLAGSVGGAGRDLTECTLWGTARSLRTTDFYTLSQAQGDGDFLPMMRDIADPRDDAYQRQLDALVALLDGQVGVLPGFDAALSVQELVEAALSQS